MTEDQLEQETLAWLQDVGYLRFFVLFEDDGQLIKKIAGYHPPQAPRGNSRRFCFGARTRMRAPLGSRLWPRHNVPMIAYWNPLHTGHAPAHEIFRGDKVACFETPARADFVLSALQGAGHELREPDQDGASALAQIHGDRYLDFLRTAWSQWLSLDPQNEQRQPFPSVWPVRSLRSDIEPVNFVARLGLYSMDNGSPLAHGTWAAAREGVDVAASAAHAVAQGARAAFCVSRPPGHHAGRDFMGGYCFLNNAAIAAQTLRNLEFERVAVLDVDYHHGNGTQSIFYERSDVFFASIHGDPLTEYPFYLGYADETGEGEGAGCNLNLPLPAGSSVAAWFEALEIACRRLGKWGATALVVSLGLDTFEGDPISHFALTAGDFVRLGERLARLGLPTVFVLEGGYAAAELGHNALCVVNGFEAVAGTA